MPDGPATETDQAISGSRDGATDRDWTRIERSPEFRELIARRHRFIYLASGVTFGAFAIYLALATYAVDLMGTRVGGVPIAWLAAMSQVLLTWAVTSVYMRKADREFGPLEQRVRDSAGARFVREGAADSAAPAEPVSNGRSAR